MKAVLIATLLLGLTVSGAMAQHRHHNHGYHHRPHHGYNHGYHHRPHHSHNYAPWVAGAVGLGILGAIIANQPTCYDRHVGYDQYGNIVMQRYCQ